MNPRNTVLRVAATSGVAAVLCGMAAAPAVAADGDVDVVNTETVQVYTSPTGEIETQRVYEQLILTGTGSVDLTNPVSTDGLRNLEGFGGVDVEGGEQVTEMTVDGEEHLRSVSDFDGELPLDVSVEYKLDGETVEPGDIVGESGELEVLYTVKNITAQPQEVSFPDGSGGTTTETVDVPIPMVGSLSTVAPDSFTNVHSDQANMAGDGKGGTKLSFTMTLFPPIGSDTAEFGYTADIVDGVVPRSDVSALPVNPLESPTFAAAADSYQGGTETGAKLAEGAATIDSNLLKLRDGASELLAGLIKLRNGSEQLQAGLADEAAPGAEKLADGAGQLDDGLGQIADGANRLFDGTGQLVAGTGDLTDGTGRLADGAGRLSDGAGRLSDGAGKAYTGSQELTDGLQQISGGLGQLADAQEGLPAAENGVKQLQAGVDLILLKLGDVDTDGTLIGGLADLETGAGRVQGGLSQLKGDGPGPMAPGLVDAKGGVDQVKAGLDGALAPANGETVPGGDLAELRLGLEGVKANFCATHPAKAQCDGLLDKLITGVDQSRTNLGAASVGLGDVAAGLSNAIATLSIPAAGCDAANPTLLCGATAVTDGAGKAKDGAIELKGGIQTKLQPGLAQLSGGITKAVAGVIKLSSGADAAATGSSDLTDGLGQIDAGAGDLADGAGDLSDGTAQLDAGANRLAAGAGELNAGAGKLADGTAEAADGSGQLADGAGQPGRGPGGRGRGFWPADRRSGPGRGRCAQAGRRCPGALRQGHEQAGRGGRGHHPDLRSDVRHDAGRRRAGADRGHGLRRT